FLRGSPAAADGGLFHGRDGTSAVATASHSSFRVSHEGHSRRALLLSACSLQWTPPENETKILRRASAQEPSRASFSASPASSDPPSLAARATARFESRRSVERVGGPAFARQVRLFFTSFALVFAPAAFLKPLEGLGL